MSSLNELMRVKQWLFQHYQGQRGLWYENSGQYGLFSDAARRLTNDPELQRRIRAFDEANQHALAIGDDDQATKKLMDSAMQEIKNKADMPSEALVSTKEEYEPKLVSVKDEWAYEIKHAANPNFHYLSDRAMLLLPTPVQASSWCDEVSRAFFQGKQSELAEASKEFLARCIPRQVYEASVCDYDYLASEKVLHISGRLLQLGIPNKNSWGVSSDDAQELCDSMKGCPITVDHEKSVRSLIGQVNRVFRDGDYLRFDGTIDDEGIIRQVKKGRVRGVSVGLEGIGACSKCGKVGFKKTCDCKGAFTWVKQIKGKEISLVTRPAYGDSSQIEEFEEVEEE